MLSQLKALREVMGVPLAKVRVESASFGATYRVCELAQCQGMCCYDGVFLEAPEVDALTTLCREHRDYLHGLGVTLPPEQLFEFIGNRSRRRVKTRLRAFSYRPSAELPAHFTATACVFRLEDGRCSLQCLSLHLGSEPWHFKPMGCWMHPLELKLGIVPRITVAGGGLSRFAGCTQCGLRQAEGKSGYEVFRDELAALSRLLDQDLLPEGV